MNRSFKHGLAVICAVFMCTACGQAEPSAAPETSAEATTTAAETTTTAKNEEETTTTKTETEAVTEETTVSTIVVTTVEVKRETETMTEAVKATEASESTGDTLVEDGTPVQDDVYLDINLNYDSIGVVSVESICAAGVLRYFGFDCTDEDFEKYMSGSGDKALENAINNYLSANANDYEVVYSTGDNRKYYLIKQELSKGNPAIIWTKDSQCGVMWYYHKMVACDNFIYYVPDGSGNYDTSSIDFDLSSYDLIVIRKK